MDGKSVHEKALLYDQELEAILHNHAPLMHKKVKIRSPWFNNDLKQLKRDKRRAELKWTNSKLDKDFIIFKQLRSKYVLECNLVKSAYYSKEVQNCEGNQKKLYKLVSKLTTGNKSTPYPECTEEKELGKMFGDFFVDKIDRIMR